MISLVNLQNKKTLWSDKTKQKTLKLTAFSSLPQILAVTCLMFNILLLLFCAEATWLMQPTSNRSLYIFPKSVSASETLVMLYSNCFGDVILSCQYGLGHWTELHSVAECCSDMEAATMSNQNRYYFFFFFNKKQIGIIPCPGFIS